MRYDIKKSSQPPVREVRRVAVDGQQAVVYYGRPVIDWPRAWML